MSRAAESTSRSAREASGTRPRGRPRVLQVGKYYFPYRGGMETHLHALATVLRRSVDLEILVSSTSRRTERGSVDGVPVTRLGTLATVASAPICPGIVGAIRRARADIAHVHLPHPAAVLAYLASGRRGPLVVTYHSDIIRQKVLGRAFEPILHRFLDRCTAIICTSPDYLESSPVLARHRERCHIVPFSIPLEPYRSPSSEAVRSIRERYGARLVLGVGRLIYYKGFEYLIEAMRHVRGRLLIIGDGPLRGELEEQARRHGVSDRVTLLGEVPDAVPYYHAADVFVLSSIARSEAFGLVQLEAMACGTPVVNTRLASGVPYVSPHGVSGLTVAPADPHALAQAISLLLDDPDLRCRLGDAGRRRVEEQFSAELMGDRTLELYRRVLRHA